jgi:hypothetical protein
MHRRTHLLIIEECKMLWCHMKANVVLETHVKNQSFIGTPENVAQVVPKDRGPCMRIFEGVRCFWLRRNHG